MDKDTEGKDRGLKDYGIIYQIVLKTTLPHGV